MWETFEVTLGLQESNHRLLRVECGDEAWNLSIFPEFLEPDRPDPCKPTSN